MNKEDKVPVYEISSIKGLKAITGDKIISDGISVWGKIQQVP